MSPHYRTSAATSTDAAAAGVDSTSAVADHGARLIGPKCGDQCGAKGTLLLLTTGRGMQGPPGEI
ncbi:hypothetical protein PG988_010646 [Apiospora saccharicola]